ncbi:superoxide dismutase, Fe-Mn family [Prevotella sp. kh1p2]|nr:superoxide dismutase, Fe-Mn family [Prevotella sp. kh1p2]SNU12375.1 superoxide dismutase, Fe-Mn family [Prevotellaceae bacterium KH2P17]
MMMVMEMPPMPYIEQAKEPEVTFRLVKSERNIVNNNSKSNKNMKVNMPVLPYAANALEPVISEQTINFHYGKHLQNYVNTINQLVEGTDLEGKSLVDIVKAAPEGPVYNNAGQSLNHTLYFLQFQAPVKGNAPKGKIAAAINAAFGSFDEFKKQFNQAATSLFGSGWAWLSQDKDGKLVITKEANGGNPVRSGLNPLMGIDVWEHAYYLDYQNRRADHVAAVWDIINWEVVESRLK